MYLGNTYLADRLSSEGNPIQSAIDHVYLSSDLTTRSIVSKLKTSSTDHVPILARIEYRIRSKPISKLKTTKRSMKNFNLVNWNQCLATKNWESLGEMENVNEMAVQFSNLVNLALDEIAPVKTFNNKPGYKAGISTETKILMKERDMARSE